MHKVLIAAAAAALLTIGAACAQPAPGGRGAMLAAADTNHDGIITRAEFDAARAARFMQMDANHNGVLEASERPQWGGGGGPPGQPANAGGAHHDRGDANGDGTISRAEYDAQSAHMFQRLDADNNGSISQAELQAMQQHMQH